VHNIPNTLNSLVGCLASLWKCFLLTSVILRTIQRLYMESATRK